MSVCFSILETDGCLIFRADAMSAWPFPASWRNSRRPSTLWLALSPPTSMRSLGATAMSSPRHTAVDENKLWASAEGKNPEPTPSGEHSRRAMRRSKRSLGRQPSGGVELATSELVIVPRLCRATHGSSSNLPRVFFSRRLQRRRLRVLCEPHEAMEKNSECPLSSTPARVLNV